MFLETILHFDIAALFIFAITIFYITYRKSYKAYSSFIFLIINIEYFMVCVLDLLVSSDVLPMIPEKIGMFLYYFLKYQTSIIYLLYIIIITNSEDIIRNKRNGILFSIPFVLTVGFLISNIFNGYIYYFDENGIYHRGQYIFVFYGLSFIYVVIGLIWIVRFIKAFSLNDIFALMSVYVLSIIALVTQYFYDEVLIEILASSISFILLSITVERSQMIVDPKTGLKNIYNFNKIMFITFKRKKEIGLIIFYVKNFAVLYEKYSYDVAVNKIRSMASYLTKAFLDGTRYECFYLGDGMIGVTTPTVNDAEVLANRMSETLLNPNYDTIVFNIDYLLFVSSIPSDFEDIDDFYKFIGDFIDSVEYDKKIVYISSLRKDDKKGVVFSLDKIIDEAIETKHIAIEFQPLLETSSKKFTMVETLARIYNDKYGIIPAESFIPYAEKKDKIYDIDMVVINNAHKAYIDLGFEELGIKNIAINISVKTLLNPNFLSDLEKIEELYHLKKDIILFEIRERENSTFDNNAFEFIDNMMKKGYLFSLDNYGVGCMPVGNLASVPFRNVKFDNSFAKGCYRKETSTIIGNTIKLFKRLNKISVCTGVETKEEAEIIESLKPDYVQGYYYSEPLVAEDLISFLKDSNR